MKTQLGNNPSILPKKFCSFPYFNVKFVLKVRLHEQTMIPENKLKSNEEYSNMSTTSPSAENRVKPNEINQLNQQIESTMSENEDTLRNMYLTFRLGSESYGIEIRYVKEIVVMQKITVVPDTPIFVKGVVNLRGQVIPVLDMRLRFNMESREYDQRTCIIVMNIEGVQVGLVVDTVNEVRNIEDEQISPPPRSAGADTAQYIQGMGKVNEQVIILLEGRNLLYDQEMAAFV